MAAPLTNFKAAGEDLADIYVDRDTVLEEGAVPEEYLSQAGIDAIYAKSLWAWGGNSQGRLGLGDAVQMSSPVQVGNLINWKSLSASINSSIAVKTDGTLWSWGSGASGVLGLNTIINRSSPVQVGSLTDWKSAEVGISHCLAVKTNGTLWSWGSGAFGPLGLNTIINRSSPVQVGSLTDWKFVSSSTATSSVGSHSLAVKTDGTLWAWGGNSQGRLGHNDLINRSSPVRVGSLTGWKFVSAGASASFAIKTDGTLWSWGNGTNGILGLGNTVNRSSPVQVGSLTDWKFMSAGSNDSLLANSSCGAVKTNGTLWSWGVNIGGKLGLNNTTTQSSPTQVGSLTNWKFVSFGYVGSNAVKTDGTLWSWGSGASGVLGLNTIINRSSPVQVGASTNWVTAQVGSNHALARRA